MKTTHGHETTVAEETGSAEIQPRHRTVSPRLAVILFIALALLSAVLAALAWTSGEADEEDVIVASANSSQNSNSATLLADGRVLVTGGWSGTTAIANADLFDPDARTWAPTAPLLTPRIFHAATRLSDGRVLITGGWDNNGDILTSAEIYDPASTAWLPAAALRNARAGHAAITLPDGRVLVVGGCFGSQASGAVSSPGQPWDVQSIAEVYDPRANSWQAAGQLAEGRCWPTATLLADGRVLVVGGSDRTGRPVAGAELYDPMRGSWSSAGRLNVAREGHTATLLPDGQVLVAGGYNGEVLASTELYNPAANAWTPAASMRQARAYHTAALLQNSNVLAIGGATSSFPSQDTEAFDPRANTWTLAGPLPAPYAFHLTTVLANGRVVVTGRPSSNDPTGNDGYPTPVGGLQTPEPPTTPGAPQHAASSQPDALAWNSKSSASGASGIRGGESVTPTPPHPLGNVTTGTGTARLYGVHEVSFTLAPVSNPYELEKLVTFTAQDGSATTVKAFYDGSSGGQDIWVARVYVNRVGAWTWSLAPGATCPASPCKFTAIDQSEVGLHGMLRVAPESATSAKRWYTDDGQTFLPKADTAYRLFLEVPPLVPPQQISPIHCPTSTLPLQPLGVADSFVVDYAESVEDHGINVLRALSLGTWAYTNDELDSLECNEDEWHCTGTVLTRTDDCNADMSLFYSDQLNGSSNNLFDPDGGPAYTEIQGSGFYPNLVSLQRTDRKLKLLLNQYPSLYVQIIIVPDPPYPIAPYRDGQTQWLSIASTLRTQLWQNMISRWAAFPNVFWSVSNDLTDEGADTNNQALAREVGCFWMGAAGSECQGLSTANDPWRQGRPMSMGHLRNKVDGSRYKPWTTYITAYSDADISAQQMDGITPLDRAPLFYYAEYAKPTYNTEDRFEGRRDNDPDRDNKVVKYPDYFYRRLFWSYVLSGSGATYGSAVTFPMFHIYDGGTYNTQTASDVPLAGLDSIQHIAAVLRQAQVDLARFRPADDLILQPTPSSTWTEYDRAQVASNPQEILAYVPSTYRESPNTQPNQSVRRGATETLTARTITIDMTEYQDEVYRVTWYEPETGQVLDSGTTSGGQFVTLAPTVTPPYPGDVVVHISSRCEPPNACQPMEGPPPTGTPVAGFEAGGDEGAVLALDSSRSALGYPGTKSWRCERPSEETGMPGCWVRHDFDNGRSVASADFYFRRNSSSSYQGLYFITTPGATGVITDGEYAISLDVWFNDAGDLYTGGDQGNIPLQMTAGVAPDLNRWYHLSARVERTAPNTYDLLVDVDGVSRQVRTGLQFASGDSGPFFRRTVVHTAWWVPTTDLPPGTDPGVWWDELSIDPPAPGEMDGLYKSVFQQGLGSYLGNHVAWFDGSTNGYDRTALLSVGANNGYKSLLRFNTASLPSQAVVDEATLELYYTGRSNGNTLTLGAHRVLAEWVDSQVNRIQRKTGSNWAVAGMGSGSDYAAAPEATLAIACAGNQWLQLDVTAAAQAWVSDPTTNYGLVLLQEAASGWVSYQFCSELGWPPCSPSQSPRLVLRYHLVEPGPTKVTFQQGVAGYSGANATCLSYASGNNNCTQFQVGANDGLKSLLRFDLSAIPAGKTVDEATLRLYYKGRSNGNPLTMGAYRLLVPWVDSQANWTQRMTGVNWNLPGLGSGADYDATADGTNAIPGDGGMWVEVDVTDMAQAWADDPAANYGLILRQAAAAGYVVYDFCSERGVAPCTAAQTPQLSIWYR